MANHMPTVNILHCGGVEELHFIQYLQSNLTSMPSFVLEYTKFRENGTKDIVMLNDAQKYKKDKVPMIVLISLSFFNTVWPTLHKQEIVNTITSYSTRNCLHIWLGVRESDVQQRSIQLLRTDGQFRKINGDELTKLQPTDMINKITSLLYENAGDDLHLDNYAVDNDPEYMKRFAAKRKHSIDEDYSVDGEEEEMRKNYKGAKATLLAKVKKIMKKKPPDSE